jgi:phosphoglycerate kinase
MQALPTLDGLDLSGRTVFLRLDLNVPMHEGRIMSEARIHAALPTIRACLAQGARLAVASHLGRPQGADAALSLEPVAAKLSELLELDVIFAQDCVGDGVRGLMHNARPSALVVLENLRFHAGEEANDAAFARELAQPFEVYINDAFGASHRAHASIVGMVRYCREVAAGPLLQREVQALERLMTPGPKPFVAAIGGAKVADKVGVLEALIGRADTLLIGGAMAYTFLRAQNHNVGMSRLEETRLRTASELLSRARDRGTRVLLPIDHIGAKSFSAAAEPVLIASPDVPDTLMGLDIGPKTQAQFAEALSDAQVAFWNGPMGVAEWPAFAKGSHAVAQAMAACPGHTVVGGGDSVAALEATGLASRIDHVSTGGGASLELLKFGSLPGIEALRQPSKGR